MAKREFKNKATQLDAKGFDNVGDSYEGTYHSYKVIHIEDKDGARDTRLYKLVPDDGAPFGVWGTPQLDGLMDDIQPGTYVAITLVGVDEPKKKGWSGMKRFEVAY